MKTEKKYQNLKQKFKEWKKVLIAFSGGVDSSFLLKIAVEVLGQKNVLAVTSFSKIHSSKELEAAKKLVKEIGVEHKIIEILVLENQKFVKNDKNRCYYCKLNLFSNLKQIASDRGYNYVIDGSNYDDQKSEDRPGRKAAQEIGVKSPLEEVKLSKKEIRDLSRKLNLTTWNKPSGTCLATRIPFGNKIENNKLKMIAQAEIILDDYDLTQLRVRHHDTMARLEIIPEEIPIIIKNRKEIIKQLKEIGYIYVTLDLEGYRTGSMNEIV